MAMSSRDVLNIDWAGRARALLDNAGAKPVVKAPAQLWPAGTYNLVEPEQKPDNIVYRTLSNPQLNRGLQNIAEAVPEAIIGEGTGNSVGDILLGFTGPGAAVGTAATGNKPGALDMLPGGGIIKAGLVGLVKAGKTAEAKAIYNILKNPIANRFANRYPEEALQSLSKFLEKHPTLKNMNTAEVYDVMQSGKLGNDFFIDLGKDYPEAVKRVMSTNDIAYTTHDGKRLSLRGIADELDKNYGKEFTGPLNKLLDRVDAMVDRGDYVDAFDQLGTAQSTMVALLDANPSIVKKQYATPGLFEKQLTEAAYKRNKSVPNQPFISTKEGGMEEVGDLVNEYMHLQVDPVDWQKIVDVDDQVAADIAAYGSIKEANKARAAQAANAALERKAAAAQAKEAHQYEQRLKEFRKNPKKALKTANSAAPRQVRLQGDAAVREWYFGKDPMEPKPSDVVKFEAAPEPVKVEPVPEPVKVEPTPEPVVETVEPVPSEVIGGPNKWRENGWVSEEHPIREPGVSYGMLGRDATEEDKRALFVIDSLANEAASRVIRNNMFKNDWPGRSTLRHRGTNYDSKAREFGTDVAWNARTGNLPTNTTSLVLRGAVSSAGNKLPGQMTGVVNGKDLYDLLFRKKVDRRINDLDSRYLLDFLGY